MNYGDCVRFANENPVCYIATMDGDQPRVRPFWMWEANENGFYFHTSFLKEVGRQLKSNPKVELCFYCPGTPPDIGKMMRIAGEIEFLEDIALRTRLLEERPFLKAMGITGPEDPLWAVFRVYKGEAWFWTMESNMRESEIERIKF